MENVRWSTPIFRADAAKVRRELVELAQSTEFMSVKPQEIVNYAQANPDSELHKCFTWDDTVAANNWRKQQARLIVNHLVVTVEDNKTGKEVVARTMMVTESDQGKVYKPVEFLQASEYAALLDRAWTEAKAWVKKYKSLHDSGIQAVIEAIEGV